MIDNQQTLNSYTLSEEDKKVKCLLGLCKSEFQLEAYNCHRWYINPRDVESESLLREYRNRLRSDFEVTHIGGDRQQREIAEKVAEHKRNVDARLSTLSYVDEDQWIVPRSEIETIRDLSYPMSGLYFHTSESKRNADWDEWTVVFNKYNVKELQFIRETIANYYKPHLDTVASCTILDTFLLKKGDDSIGIDDLVLMTNRGKGASKHTVKEHAKETIEALDPVIAGFLMQWLNEIKTNLDSQNNRSGYHSRSNKYINVTSESRMKYNREHGFCDSTTAHELSHAIHYMISLYENNTSTDNRNTKRCDWDANIVTHESLCNDKMSAYRRSMKRLWEEFKNGSITELKNYQTKNFDEFTTVAFEYWIATPDKLRKEQPQLYKIFEMYLSDSRKNLRSIEQDEMVEFVEPLGSKLRAEMVALEADMA